MRAQSYDAWEAAVDACVEQFCGLSIHDLPDVCLADWYEEGVSAARAARLAIASAKGEEE